MANKNLAKLQELSAKYNVTIQPIYTSEALAKGTLDVVHTCMIGSVKVNKLQTMTHETLENVFKRIVTGEYDSNCVKGNKANQKANKVADVMFTKDNERVSINGERYNVFDVLKNVSYSKICEIIDEGMASDRVENVERAKKIKAWWRDGGFVLWLEYQHYVETGMFIDDEVEEVARV